jgi:hypothetical protein
MARMAKMTMSINTESGNGERNGGTTMAASKSPRTTTIFVLEIPVRNMRPMV